MSKDLEMVEAFLQELLQIVNEKPALATRLAKAIDLYFRETPLDPLAVLRDHGREALSKQLSKLTSSELKDIITYRNIPCSRLSRRSKGNLIALIVEFNENRLSAHTGSDLEAA